MNGACGCWRRPGPWAGSPAACCSSTPAKPSFGPWCRYLILLAAGLLAVQDRLRAWLVRRAKRSRSRKGP